MADVPNGAHQQQPSPRVFCFGMTNRPFCVRQPFVVACNLSQNIALLQGGTGPMVLPGLLSYTPHLFTAVVECTSCEYTRINMTCFPSCCPTLEPQSRSAFASADGPSEFLQKVCPGKNSAGD